MCERIIQCELVKSEFLLVSTWQWSVKHPKPLATVHKLLFWIRLLVRTEMLSILLLLPESGVEGNQLSHASTYQWQRGDAGRDCVCDLGGSRCILQKMRGFFKIRDQMQT